ncbi:MAG: adenosylcobinamide kinase/adenosylcobinamide-phosphate guanylyltransferase [Chloroflexi bacterium]|nr:adenosylcobinamide kinase/adenosylcobinamide-phosphate guanylyltransferase [Chloroflexota bacterium]
MPPPRLALVLGGARSGKSAFAARLAQRWGGPVLFVATATADDDEMRARIAAHRRERPSTWRTLETATRVGEQVKAAAHSGGTVLVDCLTLLVSNCLGALSDPEGADVTDRLDRTVDEEVRELLVATAAAEASCIVVSSEVGMGIVPDYPSGRVYRDALGRANQYLASQAENVYLMVAGIPVDIKALAAEARPDAPA